MKEFLLKGKIIGKNNLPAGRLQVKAYDHHMVFVSDNILGQTTTQNDGTFQIRFNESHFKEFQELLERGPNVYLTIEFDNGKILKTKVMRIQKEIEYHIKLRKDTFPNTNAIDIYKDSMNRTMNLLNGMGGILQTQRINLDSLANGDLPEEIRQRFLNLRSNYDEAIKNFGNIQALISGVINSTLQQYHLDGIGYDGPQVPRNTWREGDYDVIAWPRKEEYNWG